MEPRMVSYDAFLVMGVQVTGIPMEMDFQSIWANRYMKFDAQLVALRADEAYYGVYFWTGEGQTMDFVAGVYVAPGTDPIEGVVLRKVPAASYAVFDCTMATIGPTWIAAMQEWLPAGGYEYDGAKAGWERFPTGSSAPDAPVEIYVPVKAKAA
jgi:predicted transcriptional regulator YdeE